MCCHIKKSAVVVCHEALPRELGEQKKVFPGETSKREQRDFPATGSTVGKEKVLSSPKFIIQLEFRGKDNKKLQFCKNESLSCKKIISKMALTKVYSSITLEKSYEI